MWLGRRDGPSAGTGTIASPWRIHRQCTVARLGLTERVLGSPWPLLRAKSDREESQRTHPRSNSGLC
jgi:hypothetical protein